MPSAAKLEKQASTEAVEPIRQAIIVIEHKIRNLEKRKRKIESYRELQKNGKELNSDQQSSVAKFEEVLQTLEFARDLCKQFNGIALDAAKQHKKQARKEAQERAQQELAKVKEILMVQDVLQNMGQDNVREDFLVGRNGAAQLTEEDLKYLDDIYSEVSPKHCAEEGVPPFQEQLQQSAEHLLAIVDAKPKEIVGTTYAKLKEIVATIQASGYFDQSETVDETTEEPTIEVAEEPSVVQGAPDEVTEEEEYVIEGQTVVLPSEAAAYPTVLAPVVVAAPVPTIVQQPPVIAPVPTPVGAVESSFFSTSAPAFVPAQAAIPARPLNEVIGSVSGSFNFLQESELDSPDLSVMLTGAGPAQQPQQHTGPTPPPSASAAVAPIPSQTFTNQNFAAVSTTPVQPKVVYQPTVADLAQSHIPGFVTAPNPPPPIPMPPSHQPPPQQQHRSMSPAVTYGGQVVAQGPSYASQAQQQQPPPTTLQYTTTQPQPVDPTVYSAHHAQEIVEPIEHQQVPEQPPIADEAVDEWGATDVSPGSGDWSQQTEANQGDWGQQTEEWGTTSTNQNDAYVTQTSSRGYGRGRGNRGGGGGRGGAPNGYSGGRGRGGNYQNGRGGGGGGGGYGYRNNNDGNNSYYQNGYQQRDNFGGSGGGSGNYKRGNRGSTGGPSRGGMERGGPRGGRGGSNNPRGGNRGGGSNNYVRSGGNKQ